MNRIMMTGFLFSILAATTFAGGGADYPEVTTPVSPTSTSVAVDVKLMEDPGSPPASAREYPLTDFSRSIVSFDEILSGGPPKDGIPAVDEPTFVSVKEATDWIEDTEPVLVVSHNGETHIYPVQILMWHEIVNDTVGGMPVSVTYCPLCNSSLAFKREFDGRVLDFGTSGRLRYSNMVMYDRQSETWWQQAEGQGLIGKYAGQFLEQVPALMLAWADAKGRYPRAAVVSKETGHRRPYGSNPYTGYDKSTFPFLFKGPPINGDYSPMTRVVAINHGGEIQGYPYPVLEEQVAVNDTIGGDSVVVIWQPGTASALDSSAVGSGRDVGTANGFRAAVDGQELSFSLVGDQVVDDQTGSVWDATGTAIKGKLKGQSLPPLISIQHFWFSWTAFAIPTGG